MAPLSHDEFFAKLGELFDHRRSQDHGSIFLTQKRLIDQEELPAASEDQQLPDLNPEKPCPVLIRATNGKSKEKRLAGKKVKLATVVQPDGLDAFYARYADVCKSGMVALKPRDRTKGKKKAKAKKRKGGAGQTSMKAIQ